MIINYIIGIISFSLIFVRDRFFLNVYLALYLIFFAIVPILEDYYKIAHQGISADPAVQDFGNLLLLMSLFLTLAFYFVIHPGLKPVCNLRDLEYRFVGRFLWRRAAFFLLVVGFFIYISLFSGAFSNFFIREKTGILYFFLDFNSYKIIAEYFLRSLFFFVCFFIILSINSLVGKFLFFVVLGLFCFPASFARFQALILWGVFLIVVCLDFCTIRRCLGRVVGIASITIGPMVFLGLDYFRRLDNLDFGEKDFFSNRSLFSGHFDAYQNFIHSLELDILFGKNFLGAFLFFIPRSVWVDKPVSSNQILGNAIGLANDNVGFPFVAELYLAGGAIGVVLGSVVIGIVLRLLDQRFIRHLSAGNLGGVIFMGIMGFSMFFLFRGAMLSATAYITLLVIAFMLASRICFTRN